MKPKKITVLNKSLYVEGYPVIYVTEDNFQFLGNWHLKAFEVLFDPISRNDT